MTVLFGGFLFFDVRISLQILRPSFLFLGHNNNNEKKKSNDRRLHTSWYTYEYKGRYLRCRRYVPRIQTRFGRFLSWQFWLNSFPCYVYTWRMYAIGGQGGKKNDGKRQATRCFSWKAWAPFFFRAIWSRFLFWMLLRIGWESFYFNNY